MKRLRTKHMRACFFTLALGAGCGGATVSPIVGGETHFLRACAGSCGDGLSCISGVCTKSCLVAEASCGDLAQGAVCTAASIEPGAVAVCDLGCNDVSDCSPLGSDYGCGAGFCRGPALSSSGEPTNACPAFAAGVRTPEPLETTTTFFATPSAVAFAIADSAGLYWIDRSGAVFARRAQSSEPELLASAPPSPVTITGLVSDADTLYWGEAGEPMEVIDVGPPPPPGRVKAVPKAGGPSVVVAESERAVFIPVGVVDGRVIADVADLEPGIYGVPTAGGAPERLFDRPEASSLALRGDRLYFVAGESSMLRRVSLDGSGAEDVVAVSSEFVLGANAILWKKSETVFDPLTLVENLVMLDETTGCVQDLPSLGETVSVAGLDADHVYWKSYNGLGGVSPGDTFEGLPLVRVHLRTGRFERLETAGFELTLVTDFLAEDAGALYFRVNGGIERVRKP